MHVCAWYIVDLANMWYSIYGTKLITIIVLAGIWQYIFCVASMYIVLSDNK